MQHLEDVLSALPVGVFIADEHGTILYANEQASAIWAGAPLVREIDAYAEYRGWWPETGQRVRSHEWALARAVTRGESVTGQIIDIERFDGTRATIFNSGAPIRDETGRIVGGVASVLDITEQTQRERLTRAVNQLAAEVIEDMDFDRRLQLMVNALVKSLHADAGGAFIIEGDMASLKATVGATSRIANSTVSVSEVPLSVASLKATKPILVPTPDDHPLTRRFFEGHSPWQTALVIPLKVRDAVIGSMIALFAEARPQLSAAEEDFANALMLTAPVALFNSRIIDRELRLRTIGEQLNELSIALTSTRDPQTVLDRLAALGARIMRCNTVIVGLYEDGCYRYQSAHGAPEDLLGECVRADRRQACQGEPVQAGDYTAASCDDDCALCAPMYRRLDIRSVLHIPLVVRNERIGGVTFIRTRGEQPFSAEDAEAAGKIGLTASLGVQNARLFEERRRSLRMNEALRRIGEDITSTLEFDEIMDRCVRLSAEALAAESAIMYVREDDAWVARYSYGMPAGIIGKRFMSEEFCYSEIMHTTGKTIVINDPAHDKRAFGPMIAEFDIKAVLDVPLTVGEQTVGNLALHHHSDGCHFSESDAEFLARVAATLAQALLNAQRYSAEKTVASTLQRALLALPGRVPGVSFGELYRSASKSAEVGGDFYDLFELGDTETGIILGDVSGKGLPAATMTALVKNTIRAYAYEEPSTAEVLRKANDVLLRDMHLSSFVTVLFAVLDSGTGELRYCNAGHPPAIVRRASGAIELLAEHSPVIGAWPGLEYRQAETVLGPGDVLFAYTDGATEARGGSDFFGQRRIVDAVRRSQAPVGRLPRDVYEAVMEFTGGVLGDDLAMLAVALEPANQRADRTRRPALSVHS